MKVVHINTFKNKGGAAIAAGRIMEALAFVDPSIRLTYLHQESGGIFSGSLSLLRLALEKFLLRPLLKNKADLFAFSLARFGKSLASNKDISEADIIHLHWFNQSFLSLTELEKIISSGKKIVWTFHDMWAFTGGCFYSGGCENYKKDCARCPFLKNDKPSKALLERKKGYLANENLSFVSCSHWLNDLAAQSRHVRQENLTVIHNPVAFERFIPSSKELLRQKHGFEKNEFIVLFAAAKLNDPRKGLQDLMKAIQLSLTPVRLLLIGEEKEIVDIPVGLRYTKLGFIEDSALIDEYIQLSDILACPSHQDNLPNTVLESVKCGTPVLAYLIGGLPDLIQNLRNGYLASFDGDRVANLEKGLEWCIKNAHKLNRNELRNEARKRFSYQRIGEQYLELYKEMTE